MNASTSLSLPEVATSSNENSFSSVSKSYNLDPYILDPTKMDLIQNNDNEKNRQEVWAC